MQTPKFFTFRVPQNTVPIFVTEDWCTVTFLHAGGGQVVIGVATALDPVDNGAGFLLIATVPIPILLPPNTQIYAASDVGNQNLSIAIMPVPPATISAKPTNDLGQPVMKTHPQAARRKAPPLPPMPGRGPLPMPTVPQQARRR